jgi:hypothetical protein
MVPYNSDIIYVSEDSLISENSLKCGRAIFPCLTFDYGKRKIITPDWDSKSVPPINE